MRLALLALLVAAPALRADALTRAAATAIALAALRPETETGTVVVFGLPRPLRAQQTVIEGGTASGVQTSLKPVGRAAWLFWEDLVYGAQLEHPSRLLLVDDETGAATARTLSGYPVVDGKLARFLGRKAYADRRLQIFSSVRAATAAAAPHASADARLTRRPSALPPRAFKDDCILMVGNEGPDKRFLPNFIALQGFARRHGARHFFVRSRGAGPPDGEDLRRRARELAQRERCKDILLYIAGHGHEFRTGVIVGETYKKEGGESVRVNTIDIVPADIIAIFADNPTTDFKLKIGSCYSGRFVDDLPTTNPRLLVTETSAQRDKPSWFYQPTFPDPADQNRDLPNDRQVPEKDRARAADEAMNGNLVGWERFVTSETEVERARQQGGSLFARMLERGFTLGADADFARKIGLTTPQLVSNLPAGGPPAAFVVTLDTSYRHDGATSEICVTVSTAPPRNGASARIRVVGPGVVAGRDQTITLDAAGMGSARVTIDRFGTYTVGVDVTALDGAARSQAGEQDVGQAQGACPRR